MARVKPVVRAADVGDSLHGDGFERSEVHTEGG